MYRYRATETRFPQKVALDHVPPGGEERVETTAHDRYVQAAIVLASAASVDDRLRADPSFPGDRSRRAEALRAESLARALAVFREADIALKAWCAS